MRAWRLFTLLAATACTERPGSSRPCQADLILPDGFCATIFADSLGPLRHVAVRANGDVYVARWSNQQVRGGLVALRDTNSDGRADRIETTPNDGGSGIALNGDTIYMSTWSAVLRYVLEPGELAPRGRVDTLISGIPQSGHAARSLVFSPYNHVLVNIGAPTNSCQLVDRGPGSMGRDPCPERDSFAGVWRFDTRQLNQKQWDGQQMVRGLRHAVAMAINPHDGRLYVVPHGRDELRENFPRIYDERRGERLPSEAMYRVEAGADYGWPYCYHDGFLGRSVLSPEYGGDGQRSDRCTNVPAPVATYPAHWAPNGLLFHSGKSLPAHYADGAFIVFHGGWYRPPPDNGFVVLFQPFSNLRPAGHYEIFADGFAGEDKRPNRATHRPVGMAEAPDGAMFITDDVRGTIWRVTWKGNQ